MKKSIFNILLASLVIFSISCSTKKDSTEVAEDQNKENLDSTNNKDEKKDADFAVKAADGGMYEVQLGTLAVSKASHADVKKFAQMMVDDHTKANSELKSLASTKSIVLPDVISEKCQKKYYDLDEKSKDAKKAKDFDKDYIDQMVSDHKDDIDEFQKEADNGNDPEIKSWAAGKLATLRHHLEEAQRIQDVLKKTKK